MLECLHLSINPVSLITVIPKWRNVTPDSLGTPFITLPNMFVTGTLPLVDVFKRNERKGNIAMLLYLMQPKTYTLNFCSGKIRAIIYTNNLTFFCKYLFLEHLQRCSYCHAVFKVLIYLKYISTIHSKNLLLDLTFNN